MRAVRAVLSTLVWALAVACALIFTATALVIAFRADPSQAVVRSLLRSADVLGFDVFSPYAGIAQFEGEWGRVKTGMANCGLGALVFLLVGGVASRILRPATR